MKLATRLISHLRLPRSTAGGSRWRAMIHQGAVPGMFAVLAGVLLLPADLAARAQQEAPPETPVFEESIDVRVVNVEAVVTDAEGKPARGLSPADFRLLVDDREVPIEYFAEIVGGRAVIAPDAGPGAPVAPAEVVGRSYLVFIDESFSIAKPRNNVLERIETDLPMLGPQDRMAVLAFDGRRLDVLSPWTADRAALARSLAAARSRPCRGHQLLAADRSMEQDVDTVIDAAVILELTGNELQKILDLMDMRVNPEARTQLGRTAQAMAGALRGFEAPSGRKVLILLTGGWSLRVAPRLFGPLVESANRLGYTIYPVDLAMGDRSVLNALDQLALTTGGRVANSMRQEVLKTVAADSGNYYWLGFAPSWKADDRTHRIRVEVRRPGFAVRARNSYSDLAPQTAVAMKAEGVLLFGGTAEDRRLRVEPGEARRIGRREVEVPVTLGVPVEALALTPDAERGYVAELPVAISVLDEKGGRSDLPGTRLRVVVRQVPPAGTLARFQTVIKLRRLTQRVVFTVRDPASGRFLWGEARLSL